MTDKAKLHTGDRLPALSPLQSEHMTSRGSRGVQHFRVYRLPHRLRINRRRQVGDGESPTCFESGRRILRPVFAQIGDKLVVSDVLRPILAHVRSKYSNTQHPDPQLRTTSRQTQAKGSAPLTTTNLETPQNHVSCSMWSTCPRSFSPQTRFFGPGILIIQTKKGKFAKKNTTNSGIKKLAHSRGQFCFKMFPSSQRAVAGPQIWRLPA